MPLPHEVHRTVLLREAVEALQLRHDDIVVDATLGGGGHASAILTHLWREGTLVGFDIDTTAIERVRRQLTSLASDATVVLINDNFKHLADALPANGITHITKALFDLGWSSYQLDSGRGFSFLRDEPLQMNYASSGQHVLTAAQIVNEWQESSLADVIYGFGEERYARRIAKAIVEARARKPIRTTFELVAIIRSAVPKSYQRGRIHPATRTFQALRIAVNDELGALKDGLAAAWKLLKPGGRIAVISFHSLEDRIVKHTFAQWEKTNTGVRINKKPITPSSEEINDNPRARSAKLRVIEKVGVPYERKNSKNQQVSTVDLPGEA